MNYYQKRKEEIRQQAIEWQYSWADNCYSYEELIDWQGYFYNYGKAYGLLKEFKENAIC